MFSALDWLPTLVEIAGGPKGDGLEKQLEQSGYPGIVKTTLDGVNEIDYLTGKSPKSAREVFYYFSGATPSAVRYKDWKLWRNCRERHGCGLCGPAIRRNNSAIRSFSQMASNSAGPCRVSPPTTISRRALTPSPCKATVSPPARKI